MGIGFHIPTPGASAVEPRLTLGPQQTTNVAPSIRHSKVLRQRVSLDLLSVDRESDEPLNRQIYSLLREYILQGRLPAHSLLPSSRCLAKTLKVGRNTVLAAYDQLLAEGFIASRSGSGTWVAPLLLPSRPGGRASSRTGIAHLSSLARAIDAEAEPRRSRGLLNLFPGVPDSSSFPFSIWRSLVARNAGNQDEELRGYVSFAGHEGLRQTIAGNISLARGIECNAGQVIIVTGAQAALDLVSRVLMDNGDCVWMEEPGYLGAKIPFLASGAEVAPLKVDRRGWQLANPTLPRPRLIYVTPSCQWPFGTVMGMKQRLQLLEIAERTGAFIIEDDYDGEFRFRGRPVPALTGMDHASRCIYIGTFGKTLYSALRIGYLIVPPPLSRSFENAVRIAGQFPPLAFQAALNDFIQGGHFARHVSRVRRLYAARQAHFVAQCHKLLGHWISMFENDAGMQVLATFKQPWNDLDVVAAGRKEGVDLHALSVNYHSTEPEHGLLLGYAALDDRDTIRAMQALRTAFARVGG